MKTILVPVDFSPTSKNAVIYALHLSAVVGAQKVILYHAYQLSAVATPVMTETATIPLPTIPALDIDTIESYSKVSMKTLIDSISGFCPADVVITQKTEYATMDDINEVCKNTLADLIVMGITGAGRLEEVLVGSTAIRVVTTTKTPVIIVPREARFTSIKNVMLACDFKNVAETTPVQPIKALLNATRAKLHVLNIYENDQEIPAEKSHQQNVLHSLLQEFEPQFYFKNNESFIRGINDFVEQNQIDLIVTIPKKHGFFEGLFKERHIKRLAFHSHVPLMAVHEGDL